MKFNDSAWHWLPFLWFYLNPTWFAWVDILCYAFVWRRRRSSPIVDIDYYVLCCTVKHECVHGTSVKLLLLLLQNLTAWQCTPTNWTYLRHYLEHRSVHSVIMPTSRPTSYATGPTFPFVTFSSSSSYDSFRHIFQLAIKVCPLHSNFSIGQTIPELTSKLKQLPRIQCWTEFT